MRSLPPRERNFVILTFWIGLLMFGFNGVLLSSDPSINPAHLLVIGSLFVSMALAPGARMRRGRHAFVYRFYEFPFIFGMSLGSATSVAACMVALHAVLTFIDYLRHPDLRGFLPMRFGVGSIATSLGCVVATIAPSWTWPVGYVVFILALEFFYFAYDLARGDRVYAWKALSDGFVTRLRVPVLTSIAVLVMVKVLGDYPNAAIFIAVLVVYIGIRVSQWVLRMEEMRRAWQHMEDHTALKFVSEHEEHQAIRVALEDALALYSAQRVEIVLFGSPSDGGQRYSLEAGQVRGRGMDIDPIPWVEGGDVLPKDTEDSKVLRLESGERVFGYMVIEWDPADRGTHVVMHNMFRNAVSGAIQNTRHTRQVADQAHEKAEQAKKDPLTGLGNRAMLSEDGPVLLVESQEILRKCALLLFDLDGFKHINDSLGHAAGDVVLVEVARRLKESVRRNDLAIRLGGDEFAVLAVDLEIPTDAEALANKILKALSTEPIEVKDLSISIESSIGIAMFPDDTAESPDSGEDIEKLLKLADIAMYEAKRVGGGRWARYTSTINRHSRRELRLSSDLRRAVYARDQLVLHYQPQVDLRTGDVVGFEGLVRWNHPTYGLLGPHEFVHLAEQSNRIRPFTKEIIKQALRDRARMKDVLPGATVSVNLSRQNLLDSGLPGDVEKLLKEFGVEPGELVLEVTETSKTKDTITSNRVLNELATLGCHIAVDDFGTGTATIESLAEPDSSSPVTEIKIPRPYIKNIAADEAARNIAGAIIRLAQAFDCHVVAEGIEDERTYDLLREMNCDVAQGFWMHKPAPIEEVLVWAEQGSGGRWLADLRARERAMEIGVHHEAG